MATRIVLLSGHVYAGKTTLALALRDRFGAIHVKTSECIRAMIADVPAERSALQKAGERLDRQTSGAWVLRALQQQLEDLAILDDDAIIVFDCVRLRGQINAIRHGFGTRVVHLHLDASNEVRAKRYRAHPRRDIVELTTYDEIMADPTEQAVAQLADMADVVISTERCNPEDVLQRAAAHAGFFGKTYERLVDVVVGGQYGSEGKGQISSYLASEYDVLVRVGGPNAGHTVWQEPKPYTFHHLPSGTNSSPSAQLILGAGITINVRTLMKEIADCGVEADRLAIDPQAMIISEADINDESSLRDAMGSTAQGVGLATARRIRERDLPRGACTIAENVPELKPYLKATSHLLDDHFRRNRRIMLEGTQGTGLSLYHGSYPYVTSRDTTVAGCLADAGISPSRVRKVVMVCRTYPIRVESPRGGTSGPMSVGTSWAEISRRSGIPVSELRRVERTSTTDRRRRVSEFDWALLRRSASLNAPTDIALTFVDYIDKSNRQASRVEQLTEKTIRFIEEVEGVAKSPVTLMSVRFHARGVIDRRRW